MIESSETNKKSISRNAFRNDQETIVGYAVN